MQVWLNDRVVPLEQAHISPFDRGFLFGDGIYELVRFFDGVAKARGEFKETGASLDQRGISFAL